MDPPRCHTDDFSLGFHFRYRYCFSTYSCYSHMNKINLLEHIDFHLFGFKDFNWISTGRRWEEGHGQSGLQPPIPLPCAAVWLYSRKNRCYLTDAISHFWENDSVLRRLRTWITFFFNIWVNTLKLEYFFKNVSVKNLMDGYALIHFYLFCNSSIKFWNARALL